MKTRKIIEDAVKRLLEEKSFERITVSEIIETAGVSKPTFYRYFKSKYDLAAAIFSDCITKDILMQYNGKNYDEFQKMIYEIIKENRKYLKKVLKTDGPESFYQFLIKYISESYMQHGRERFGIEKFSEEQLFKIDMVASTWARCIKKWVDSDCKTSINLLIFWMKDVALTAEDMFSDVN